MREARERMVCLMVNEAAACLGERLAENAATPYDSLEPDELDELIKALQPLATLLLAVQDWS